MKQVQKKLSYVLLTLSFLLSSAGAATWKPAIAAYDVGIPYQNFNPFVQSKGVTNTDWYETYLSEFIVDIPTADVWAW
ncbi:MAG: hypothetical protein V7459_15900 [Oceanicoccus sp.]